MITKFLALCRQVIHVGSLMLFHHKTIFKMTNLFCSYNIVILVKYLTLPLRKLFVNDFNSINGNQLFDITGAEM